MFRSSLISLMLVSCGIFATCIYAQQAKFIDVTATKSLANFTSMSGDGHGPGAVFTDLNGDGYADVYMMNAFGGPNALFVNTPAPDGLRTFTRAVDDAGAGDVGWSTGAIAGDYDNDGDTDLFVLNFDQPNALYRNQLSETGQFSYINITPQTVPRTATDSQLGLANAVHDGQVLDESLTAAWADPDRDGDLDLYVGNHFEFFGSDGLEPGEVPGQRDIFYRNLGDGTFEDMTMSVGVPGYETATGDHSTTYQNFSSSNAVIFADFNNDVWPDLLVTNKVGGPDDRNMLYVNRGEDTDGHWLGYKLMTYAMPTEFGHRSGGAMGVDVGDLDHDGDLDFYITDWSNPALYPEGGDNDYWINQLAESGTLDFIHSDQLPALFSWGTQLEDFDNNGWEDVHVATDANVADFLYLNSAEGLGDNSSAMAGVDQIDNARGDQSADYDRDGWLDLLVINPYDGPSVLYENRSDELVPENHFLSLKLVGNPHLPGRWRSSRDAIGARVSIWADIDGDGNLEDQERMLREVVSGSSNAASTSSLDVEIGLGAATSAIVDIVWPSGRITSLEMAANQFVALHELLADFNGDGLVDVADLAEWQGHYPADVDGDQLSGDSDQDGDIDGIDFLHWQISYGSVVRQGDAAAATEAVPEPNTPIWLLLLLAATGRRLWPRWW